MGGACDVDVRIIRIKVDIEDKGGIEDIVMALTGLMLLGIESICGLL
jgi:hypothetical protein